MDTYITSTGKDPAWPNPPKGLRYDVVMTLTDSLHNNRRIVYTDNFYTSLELFINLIVIRYICKWHSSYAPTKNTFSLYNNATKTYLGELNVTYSVIGQSTPVISVKFDINVNMLQQLPGTLWNECPRMLYII